MRTHPAHPLPTGLQFRKVSLLKKCQYRQLLSVIDLRFCRNPILVIRVKMI